jgi:hypothetical protein
MAKMPNIVRSRLARRTPGSANTHPDANLLAAFAEQTLLPRERTEVTAHLADCADCREYLAVAFTIESSDMTVAHSMGAVSRGGFGQWRRATAVAACCVLATALQYEAQPPALVVARRAVTVNTSSNIVDSIAAARKPTPEPGPAQARKKAEHPRSQPPSTLLAAKENIALESEPPQITAQAPVVLTAPPPAEALVAQRLQPASADAKSSFVSPQQESSAQAVATGSAVRSSPAVPAPVRAKPAPAIRGHGFQAQALTQRTPASPTVIVKTAIAPEAPRVLWSINASPDTSGASRGVVQRSTDAGQTWEAVSVRERVSFRAVASDGSDVWAGGSDAALFHSSDSGEHWEQIQVAQEDATASGAIVRIDISRTGEIRITTSSGEDWASSDTGRHWKRQ